MTPPDRIKVTVTAQHVRDGEPCMPGYCPITLALVEQYPDMKPWSTTTEHAWSNEWDTERNRTVFYDLSRAASRWIRKLDKTRHVRGKQGPPPPKTPATFWFTRNGSE